MLWSQIFNVGKALGVPHSLVDLFSVADMPIMLDYFRIEYVVDCVFFYKYTTKIGDLISYLRIRKARLNSSSSGDSESINRLLKILMLSSFFL